MGAKMKNQKGFTIIETMLFLAVTGALILGVLIGTGASLNNQRYRDAVETFKGQLQSQYSTLGSIRNARSNTWSCGADAKPVEEGTVIRGQSDCSIVGSLMVINNSEINTYSVLARENNTTTSQTSDIESLKQNFTYNVSSAEVAKSKMEWGTKIAWPKSGSGANNSGDRAISILVMRSPQTGNVYTFTGNSAPQSVDDVNSDAIVELIQAEASIPGRGERTLCINSDNLFVGGESDVYIGQFASSASAIEVRTNAFMRENLGSGAPQC